MKREGISEQLLRRTAQLPASGEEMEDLRLSDGKRTLPRRVARRLLDHRKSSAYRILKRLQNSFLNASKCRSESINQVT